MAESLGAGSNRSQAGLVARFGPPVLRVESPNAAGPARGRRLSPTKPGKVLLRIL